MPAQDDLVKELAQRVTGKDEVLLLWHPDSDRVELAVRDVGTGVSFHLDVAPGDAMDAFYHPYAYAARRNDSDREVRAARSSVDA